MGGTGSGGRSRGQKTVAQREQDGSRKRPWHFKQPEPLPGEPTCPAWLTDDERTWWLELAGTLREQQRLTRDTVYWLNAAAAAMVVMLRWRAMAAESPLVFDKVSVDGAGVEHVEPKAHPAHLKYSAAIEGVRKLLAEAGLTPVSMSRVKMPAQRPKEPDALEALQQQGQTGIWRVK
uniref:Putative terminase n=1 Tax=viral metagenome TaxID=1070528 RepID=A0A6M3J9H8_9ZZZZ